MERNKIIKSRARELRKNPTDAERLLWTHLSYRQLGGYRFRRQHPVGGFIVDFVCLEKGLVIELDGGQHQQGAEYDSGRSERLKALGFRVIRFWNNQVFQETESVKEAILAEILSY